MSTPEEQPPMNLPDTAWAWDAVLAEDKHADLSEFVAHCNCPEPRDRLLVELLRCQGSRWDWSLDWLHQAQAILQSEQDSAFLLVSLARGVFQDQLETNHIPSWELFRQCHLSAETLALRAEDDALVLGQIVAAKYQLTERLGSGRFGVVYRAKLLNESGFVAIKAPHGRDITERQRAAKLIRKESKALQVTAGPGIPKWHELYVDPETELPLLVMEFIPGHLLSRVLLPLEPDRAVKICRDLAIVLDRLHVNQYLHRDLKRENVMLSNEKDVVLLDFGLAITEDEQFADDTARAGTIPYMSIEALLGMHTTLDGRSDIFALGTILYELLTARPITTGENRESAFVDAVVRSTYELPFPEAVPSNVRQICERCLARSPNDRFGTAAELAEALNNCLKHETESLPADSMLLLAWRIGLKFGQFAEYVAVYRQHLVGTAQQMELDLAKAKVSAGYTAMYAMGISTSVEELRSLSSEIGEKIDELPGEPLYRTALYHQAKLIASGELAQMAAVENELRLRVEKDYERLQQKLGLYSPRAKALFNFAIQGTLSPNGDIAAQELRELATSAEMPGVILDPFVAVIEQKAKPETVRRELDRLSLGVERWLVRE